MLEFTSLVAFTSPETDKHLAGIYFDVARVSLL